MSVDKGQIYVLTDRAGFTHTVTVDHVAEYLFDDGATENAIVDGNGLEWPARLLPRGSTWSDVARPSLFQVSVERVVLGHVGIAYEAVLTLNRLAPCRPGKNGDSGKHDGGQTPKMAPNRIEGLFQFGA